MTRIAKRICLLLSLPMIVPGGLFTSAQEPTPAVKSEAKDQETQPKPFTVRVADDNIRFTATGTWESVTPKSRIVEFEIKVPHEEGDEQDGRLTIMGAGGTIDANIVRWQEQFSQADGKATKDATKIKKEKIAGQNVTFVDITGTFSDSMGGGPFSGGTKVDRENYRMLAAIVETTEDGNYFVKLYGPKKTIEKNAEHFEAMIKSLTVAK